MAGEGEHVPRGEFDPPPFVPYTEGARAGTAAAGGTQSGVMNQTGGHLLISGPTAKDGSSSVRSEAGTSLASGNPADSRSASQIAPALMPEGLARPTPTTAGSGSASQIAPTSMNEDVVRPASTAPLVPLPATSPAGPVPLTNSLHLYKEFLFHKLVDFSLYQDRTASGLPKNQVFYVDFKLKDRDTPVNQILRNTYTDLSKFADLLVNIPKKQLLFPGLRLEAKSLSLIVTAMKQVSSGGWEILCLKNGETFSWLQVSHVVKLVTNEAGEQLADLTQAARVHWLAKFKEWGSQQAPVVNVISGDIASTNIVTDKRAHRTRSPPSTQSPPKRRKRTSLGAAAPQPRRSERDPELAQLKKQVETLEKERNKKSQIQQRPSPPRDRSELSAFAATQVRLYDAKLRETVKDPATLLLAQTQSHLFDKLLNGVLSDFLLQLKEP